MVDDLGAAHRFSQLPAQEQVHYRAVAQQMVRLAQHCAVPIIFAPPLRIGGKLNGATGCVLQLGSVSFVVTASHVLREYQDRLRLGEVLNWQVGALPPFDPLPRVAWRDENRDIVFLRVTEEEAKATGGVSSCVVSPSTGWPPRAPEVGQIVLVSGYPKALREVDASGWIGAGPYSGMFRVTRTGDGYFYCQIEQKDLISFDGGPLPAPGSDVGGVSGGPALLVGTIVYPLVGVVTEHSRHFDLLRIATLDSVDEKELR